LRTPLTITRTLLEVALLDSGGNEKVRQLATTLLAVNQRHEKLTDGLLTLASSEQNAVSLAPVDLADIAAHVLEDMRPLAEGAGVALMAELGAAFALGDAFLLERLVHNLVENGIQYNLPEGGWVRVRTETGTDGVSILVENTGPIVPAYEVPGLFEPFRRLAATERLASATRGPAVRGAGLGLSIVRSIANAHQGELRAEPRDGGGLVVRLRIVATPDGLTPA
jgi:signal transduction histidine kinase